MRMHFQSKAEVFMKLHPLVTCNIVTNLRVILSQVEAMGGTSSLEYQKFREHCYNAFLTLRRLAASYELLPMQCPIHPKYMITHFRLNACVTKHCTCPLYSAKVGVEPAFTEFAEITRLLSWPLLLYITTQQSCTLLLMAPGGINGC